MPRFTVRRTRHFALWAGLACLLVLAPVFWMLHVLASNVDSPMLPIVIAIAVLIAGGLIVGLLTLLFARTLRTLIARLRHIVYQETARPPQTSEYRSLFDEFEHLGHQIASDQQMLRRRNAEQRLLATVSRSLNHASQLDEMMDTVMDEMAALDLYHRGYIALNPEEGDTPVILGSRGYSEHEIASLQAPEDKAEETAARTCLPLRTASGTIGTLCLETDTLDQDTWQTLNLLADILATTIEKHRLFESAQREVRVQKLLNEAGRVLTSTLDRDEVLTRIMGEVIQALDTVAGSIVLVDEEQNDLVFATAVGPQSEDLIGTHMPTDQGIVGWSITHGESLLSSDAHTDPRFYEEIDQQTGLSTQSVLCVPLSSKDRVIGAIEVLNPHTGQFGRRDLQVLESLSPQAAIAIENASLFESIKHQMAELERAQDQLLQAEKLSAIGRLVAGVAHELNNPLTAIVGYAQLLLETCQDPEICEDLERINREAQRSARIVQNLLAFARQQKMEKHAIDLRDVLDKTIDLLLYQLEVDNITLVRDIAPTKMTVLGDNYQLQQVFINLITNAHQAMRKANGRGTLAIRSEFSDSGTALVYISDDGPGVPKDIAHRIFDPFFTTKDVGEGTGLGLSICLGILQEHQGKIWLDENASSGATFVVELPLHRETHVQKPEQGSDQHVTSRTSLSILVADDELEIASLLRRILEGEGHQVVTVNDGHAAQEALDQTAFDLMICDLKMPGMSGDQLYHYLEQAHPYLVNRVIFTTGDTVSETSWSFLSQMDGRYLSKPFKPREILAKIDEIVSETGAPSVPARSIHHPVT